MGKISINELATVLIERKKLKRKSASAFVNELFYLIQKGLGEDKIVKVKGLGTFKIIDVDDRESVNVNNGERVLIEGHSKITFTPDSLMKELVNKPFSQFETVVLNEGVDFEPELEQEPEPESEPTPEQETADDVDASMAPLVEFVTDNELQISPEIEPEIMPEPEPEPEPEPVEDVFSREEEISIGEIEAPLDKTETLFVETKAPDVPIEASIPENETPVDENETPVIEEPEPSSEKIELDFEEESSGRWKMWLLEILACCLCFAGGYYAGKYYGGVSTTAESQVKVAKPKAEASKPEQVKTETAEPADKPEIKPEIKSEAKSEAKPVTQPEPAVELDQYEKMDSRIRTGAYRIVGTDHVEKVKASDNLSRICKRTIGPGMECYLEVFNGIKGDAGLKVGQEIKIPKLERKKKKVKNDN